MYTQVLLAELRETEYYYAVKCLKKDVVLEDDDVECTLIERKVLALGTNHPYLCHLFATFQTDVSCLLIPQFNNSYCRETYLCRATEGNSRGSGVYS
jgi:novel protein kinase C delta type